MTDQIRVLTNCALGVGFSWHSFREGLRREPHLIGADGGTADMGPHALGTDPKGHVSASVKRDVDIMLRGSRDFDIPMAIGTAGNAGGEPHLQSLWGLVKDIAQSEGYHFRAALVHAELDPSMLEERLRDGLIAPLGHDRELTIDDLRRSKRIVGMACGEPYDRAWASGADLVLAGRSADPAIFAPFLIRHGIPPAVAWHAGKTIDKGHNATTDWWQGSSLMAHVDSGGFTIEPMKSESECTVASVAAMTMYEHTNPHRYVLSEGVLDTSASRFEQVDPRIVRVEGSRFEPADGYTVKLEGSAPVGYRSIVLGGLRDPLLIENTPEILEGVPKVVDRAMSSAGVKREDYTLKFRPYGMGAVMGPLEQEVLNPPEMCLVIEAIATTQAIASAVASKAGGLVSHANYPGKLSRNMAYPFSPSVIEMGPVFEWSVWHLLNTSKDDLDQLFPVEVVDL